MCLDCIFLFNLPFLNKIKSHFFGKRPRRASHHRRSLGLAAARAAAYITLHSLYNTKLITEVMCERDFCM